MLYQLSVISTTNVLVGSLASLHLIPPLLSFAHLWHHHITALGWPINVYVNAILPSPALLAIVPTSSRCRPLLPDLLYQRAFLAILPTCPRVAVLFSPNSSTRGTPLWPRRSKHCTQVFWLSPVRSLPLLHDSLTIDFFWRLNAIPPWGSMMWRREDAMAKVR